MKYTYTYLRPTGLLLTVCALSAWGGISSVSSASAAQLTATTNATTLTTVGLSKASYSVSQSTGEAIITVARSAFNGATSVKYATSNGTAVSSANYTAISGTISWSAGQTGSHIFIVHLSSTPFSGSKTFNVTLSNASGATLGSPHSAVVTVVGSKTVSTVSSGGSGPAAKLAAKLGLPSQLLLGLGGQGATDQVTDIQTLALKVHIYERYLGKGDWTSWNNPPCNYVCVMAGDAHTVGAIPMYTYYQMANNGDGNVAVVNDAAFMETYWARMKLLFESIAALKTPALVHVEPDFWGYVERKAPGADPARYPAVVSSNPDCANLANNVVGYTGCVLAMARKYAPNAFVGFSPSAWGGDSNAEVVAFMNAAGAQHADFIVEQTLDRDAGCAEAKPQLSYCIRPATGWYWDETNEKHPNFQDHLAQAQAYHSGIGNLPIIWWQTPLGVPSGTPGGTPYHYRDNRAHYFLTHPAELVAVGGLAVVFGVGEIHQTNVTTDGGEYQALSGTYLSAPVALP